MIIHICDAKVYKWKDMTFSAGKKRKKKKKEKLMFVTITGAKESMTSEL